MADLNSDISAEWTKDKVPHTDEIEWLRIFFGNS
tara:strand:+ start:449 stop:550 length:102 start_codon:yes stop_codon:yes gene_type:complete